MPKDLGITLILCSRLRFLCGCFLRGFFFWHIVLLNTNDAEREHYQLARFSAFRLSSLRPHENRKLLSILLVCQMSTSVKHSCRMGARNQEQTRGRIGPQLRLGNLRVGELHFCPLCTALDQASSLSRKLAYVPGPTFGFVKLLASSGSHCTK